jgi:hypothetical protein
VSSTNHVTEVGRYVGCRSKTFCGTRLGINLGDRGYIHLMGSSCHGSTMVLVGVKRGGEEWVNDYVA